MTNKWQGYGIDELQARKMLVKARVDMQRKELQDSYRGVIEPVQNSGSVSKFILSKAIGSIPIVDGVFWGFRLVSNVLRMVKRFRR